MHTQVHAGRIRGQKRGPERCLEQRTTERREATHHENTEGSSPEYQEQYRKEEVCRGSDEPVLRAAGRLEREERKVEVTRDQRHRNVVVKSHFPIKGKITLAHRRQSRWGVSGEIGKRSGEGPNIWVEESKSSAKGQARAEESVEDTGLMHVHLRTRGGRPVCTQRAVCRGGGVFLKKLTPHRGQKTNWQR